MCLEDYLRRDAETFPDKVAVACGEESVTYSQLYDMVRAKSVELRQCHECDGKIIVFRSSQTIDFLVTYFAIHLSGGVACPLGKDTPAEQYVGIREKFSAYKLPNTIADILYTTGTTGKSKGVMISHNTIIADGENLIASQGFAHDTVFVICGPLNHIGCLSKIYPIIMLGGTLVILDGMKDINLFFHALDYPSERIATFLVPASIRMLIQFSGRRLAEYAHKIDFIETGAAPISHADMLALCRLLPGSRLYNTYASTETGIISTYNFNDGRCLVGCLGKPMIHSQVIITDEGLLSCKGDTLMSGYIGDGKLTSKVLHNGTVFTSDCGRLDADGIHLSGRNDDVINVGGLKVSPSDVEDVAMSLPCIADCICVSASHPVIGNMLKLLVVLKDNAVLDKKMIARHIASKLEPYKVPTAYEQVAEIKRTYNGKLDRKFYQRASLT